MSPSIESMIRNGPSDDGLGAGHQGRVNVKRLDEGGDFRKSHRTAHKGQSRQVNQTPHAGSRHSENKNFHYCS